MDAEVAYAELAEVAGAWTHPIEVHRQLPSTQTRAIEFAKSPVVVVAVEQDQGMGRQGRSWSSPPGGLWFSLVQPLTAVEGLSLLAGLAVARVLRSFGIDPWMRWPNDILVGRRKLAGILVDARWAGERGVAIVGIGLNVAVDPANWSADAQSLAGNLADLGIPRPHLGRLLLMILNEWSGLVGTGLASCHQELSQLIIGSGRDIEFHESGQKYNDRMTGLEEDGSLRLASGRRLYTVERLVVLD